MFLKTFQRGDCCNSYHNHLCMFLAFLQYFLKALICKIVPHGNKLLCLSCFVVTSQMHTIAPLLHVKGSLALSY